MLRLDRILANAGLCTRSGARQWIAAGRITDESGAALTDPGLRLDPASIRIDGAPLEFPHGLLIALHKPAGFACSRSPAEAPLVYDILPHAWMRRNPPPVTAGRLDRDTTGLLILTDDGGVVHRLTSPARHLAKVYEVTVDRPVPPDLPEQFASGSLMLDGERKPCLPAEVVLTGERTARITLHEGRHHQVRRMFASQGCTVVSLHRTAIGALTLGDLAPGEWRRISLAAIEGAREDSPACSAGAAVAEA